MPKTLEQRQKDRGRYRVNAYVTATGNVITHEEDLGPGLGLACLRTSERQKSFPAIGTQVLKALGCEFLSTWIQRDAR